MVKAIKYKTKIIIDNTGKEKIIEEIYTPKYNVAFNSEGFYFECNEKRNPIEGTEKEIELTEYFIFNLSMLRTVIKNIKWKFLEIFDESEI